MSSAGANGDGTNGGTVENLVFASWKEVKHKEPPSYIEFLLVTAEGDEVLAITADDHGNSHYQYRSTPAFLAKYGSLSSKNRAETISWLEMVIKESRVKVDGQLAMEEAHAGEPTPDNPLGLYYTQHKMERTAHPDGSHTQQYHLLDQHGAWHLAVVGEERARDGHYLYKATEQFAVRHPLQCHSQKDVIHWLEQRITHHPPRAHAAHTPHASAHGAHSADAANGVGGVAEGYASGIGLPEPAAADGGASRMAADGGVSATAPPALILPPDEQPSPGVTPPPAQPPSNPEPLQLQPPPQLGEAALTSGQPADQAQAPLLGLLPGQTLSAAPGQQPSEPQPPGQSLELTLEAPAGAGGLFEIAPLQLQPPADGMGFPLNGAPGNMSQPGAWPALPVPGVSQQEAREQPGAASAGPPGPLHAPPASPFPSLPQQNGSHGGQSAGHGLPQPEQQAALVPQSSGPACPGDGAAGGAGGVLPGNCEQQQGLQQHYGAQHGGMQGMQAPPQSHTLQGGQQQFGQQPLHAAAQQPAAQAPVLQPQQLPLQQQGQPQGPLDLQPMQGLQLPQPPPLQLSQAEAQAGLQGGAAAAATAAAAAAAQQQQQEQQRQQQEFQIQFQYQMQLQLQQLQGQQLAGLSQAQGIQGTQMPQFPGLFGSMMQDATGGQQTPGNGPLNMHTQLQQQTPQLQLQQWPFQQPFQAQQQWPQQPQDQQLQQQQWPQQQAYQPTPQQLFPQAQQQTQQQLQPLFQSPAGGFGLQQQQQMPALGGQLQFPNSPFGPLGGLQGPPGAGWQQGGGNPGAFGMQQQQQHQLGDSGMLAGGNGAGMGMGANGGAMQGQGLPPMPPNMGLASPAWPQDPSMYGGASLPGFQYTGPPFFGAPSQSGQSNTLPDSMGVGAPGSMSGNGGFNPLGFNPALTPQPAGGAMPQGQGAYGAGAAGAVPYQQQQAGPSTLPPARAKEAGPGSHHHGGRGGHGGRGSGSKHKLAGVAEVAHKRKLARIAAAGEEAVRAAQGAYLASLRHAAMTEAAQQEALRKTIASWVRGQVSEEEANVSTWHDTLEQLLRDADRGRTVEAPFLATDHLLELTRSGAEGTALAAARAVASGPFEVLAVRAPSAPPGAATTPAVDAAAAAHAAAAGVPAAPLPPPQAPVESAPLPVAAPAPAQPQRQPSSEAMPSQAEQMAAVTSLKALLMDADGSSLLGLGSGLGDVASAGGQGTEGAAGAASGVPAEALPGSSPAHLGADAAAAAPVAGPGGAEATGCAPGQPAEAIAAQRRVSETQAGVPAGQECAAQQQGAGTAAAPAAANDVEMTDARTPVVAEQGGSSVPAPGADVATLGTGAAAAPPAAVAASPVPLDAAAQAVAPEPGTRDVAAVAVAAHAAEAAPAPACKPPGPVGATATVACAGSARSWAFADPSTCRHGVRVALESLREVAALCPPVTSMAASRLVDTVKQYTSHPHPAVSTLASEILKRWRGTLIHRLRLMADSRCYQDPVAALEAKIQANEITFPNWTDVLGGTRSVVVPDATAPTSATPAAAAFAAPTASPTPTCTPPPLPALTPAPMTTAPPSVAATSAAGGGDAYTPLGGPLSFAATPATGTPAAGFPATDAPTTGISELPSITVSPAEVGPAIAPAGTTAEPPSPAAAGPGPLAGSPVGSPRPSAASHAAPGTPRGLFDAATASAAAAQEPAVTPQLFGRTSASLTGPPPPVEALRQPVGLVEPEALLPPPPAPPPQPSPTEPPPPPAAVTPVAEPPPTAEPQPETAPEPFVSEPSELLAQQTPHAVPPPAQPQLQELAPPSLATPSSLPTPSAAAPPPQPAVPNLSPLAPALSTPAAPVSALEPAAALLAASVKTLAAAVRPGGATGAGGTPVPPMSLAQLQSVTALAQSMRKLARTKNAAHVAGEQAGGGQAEADLALQSLEQQMQQQVLQLQQGLGLNQGLGALGGAGVPQLFMPPVSPAAAAAGQAPPPQQQQAAWLAGWASLPSPAPLATQPLQIEPLQTSLPSPAPLQGVEQSGGAAPSSLLLGLGLPLPGTAGVGAEGPGAAASAACPAPQTATTASTPQEPGGGNASALTGAPVGVGAEGSASGGDVEMADAEAAATGDAGGVAAAAQGT